MKKYLMKNKDRIAIKLNLEFISMILILGIFPQLVKLITRQKIINNVYIQLIDCINSIFKNQSP